MFQFQMPLRPTRTVACWLGWALLSGLPLRSAQQPLDVKAFFNRTCAVCHGPDGSGRLPTGQRLPGRPLNDSRWQAKETDSDLIRAILDGRRAMPGFKVQLTETEVKRLVTEVIRPLAARKNSVK
jgi:mono/diheme cytochrome c family protein